MRKPPIGALVGLTLLLPMSVGAQDAPTMVVRVHQDGSPVADVPVQEFVDGDIRVLAVTSASGLAVVEIGRSRLQVGRSAAAFVVACGERPVVILLRVGADLPVDTDRCDRMSLGTLNWGVEERLVVALGAEPAMDVMATEAERTLVLGTRVQLGPVLSVPSLSAEGTSNDLDAGVGAELQFGRDWRGGFGLGGGVGISIHGLEGADESLTHWSVFVQPRFTFSAERPGGRPYLMGRIAYTLLNPEQGAGQANEKGWGVGGGAGLLIPAGRLTIDLWTSVVALSTDANVAGFSNSSRSGTEWRTGGSLRF